MTRSAITKVAIAMAIFLFTIAHYRGMSVSPDSRHYLSGVLSSEYPPLYSWLLLLFKPLGLHVALWVLLATLLDDHMDTWLFVLMCLTPPMVFVGRYVWSELTYITLTAFTLIELQRARYRLPVLILLAIAAPLTRYIGVVNVALVCLFVWRRTSLRRAVVVGLTASVPLLLWVARNAYADGNLLGYRVPADVTVAHNLYRLVAALGSMVYPSENIITGGVLVVVLIGVIVTLYRRGALWQPITVYITLYSLMILWSASSYQFNAIGLRLFAPLVVPLFLLVQQVLRTCKS